jgi:hypothetical protein
VEVEVAAAAAAVEVAAVAAAAEVAVAAAVEVHSPAIYSATASHHTHVVEVGFLGLRRLR